MNDPKAMRLGELLRAAQAALGSGDLAAARAIAHQATREHLRHPGLLRLQAGALAEAGRYSEAGGLLNQALALAPGDASTITDIGRLLVAENRVPEAIELFKAAIQANPGLAGHWYELGSVYDVVDDDDAAKPAYERARSLAPGATEPWAALASIAARAGNLDEAFTLATEAATRNPDNPLAGLVLARVVLGRRDFEEARDRLETLLKGGRLLDERQQQWAWAMLGDALDALGNTAEAFAAYTRMNEIMLETNQRQFGEGGRVESHLDLVRRLTAWFERQDPASWSLPPPLDGYRSPVRRHVFLLGYPRSGNTLIENVLASLPGVRVLEERPTLSESDAAFLATDAGLDALMHVDATVANRHRAAYWNRVRAELPDLDDKVFVDMGPLNGIKLQVISRLFPEAMIVRCQRDPRNVVLSCFRRHFKVNPATYQMGRLDTAARHFDVVTRLTDMHLRCLPLQSHVVDYAGLVADFDATTRALAEFVGVSWVEEARSFNRTAARRGALTASAHQVRQELFDGTGQWVRYREQMSGVLPLLEPWVRRFGHEL